MTRSNQRFRFEIVTAAMALALSAPAFGQLAKGQLSIPEIAFDSTPNFLKLTDKIPLGEASGVARDSKGNVYVYTRTGGNVVTEGAARAFEIGSSRLFKFDANGNFVRELGQNAYGFVFAHAVRVDAEDNVWVVDEGSHMVIKFNPEGRIVMTMGRKAENLRIPEPPPAPPPAGRGGAPPPPQGVGRDTDVFNRPTDVAFDAQGNIFVSDGYGNSRVAKFDRSGRFLKSWGQRGSAPSQFNTPHSIAVDAQGNVYVADRGNKRIQVFDNDGQFKAQYLNVGAPWAICISGGAHQYLFSSNSNNTTDMENGEIYKMELDGKIVGKFGTAGKLLKEFGSTHALDCRDPNQILVGELTNWRVQKLTLK